MSAIVKRTMVTVVGTPDQLGKIVLPEGVPADAVVIAAEVRLFEDTRLDQAGWTSRATSSMLALTLEWPA